MTLSSPDEQWMSRALTIAARGLGSVEPNPAVGAVVTTATGDFVAEGWHQQFGGPHAEVHAIRAAGDRCRGATLYVTLEPCSHHGKTPPCADAVIAAGFRRVIVGCQDPAPHVAGQGLRKLREAGIEVVTGVCEGAAQRLIAPFSMLQTCQRPWVIAKWAMSLDGRIATHTGDSQWISNSTSREFVHQMRGRMDAIITGSGTVHADNPRLTA
ncbi:MAG: bifunctional diaminohydroxyphosphoribosylaminopyrimidine deaminase/5-amino-6-(5-phosphoribosylamino)uracil reductase RibD, partial [Planctomycetaceae bacterium]|nr:bifunctional diaminohydroxyphosphoribosylaminopyrimidine deaminase/5-amino-6-(5-phosphoribosylamino)uracil reductase RibD [Planctomycetaceae bacterium]